jgi:hypothetical protein
MQIYLFQVSYKEGEITDIQLYANDYYRAWDAMILLNPVFEDITLNGIEFTTMPLDYCDYTELILNN